MSSVELKTCLDLKCRGCGGEVQADLSRFPGRDPIVVVQPCQECISRAEEAIRGVNLKALDEAQAA
jgi:hypothetical protein